MKANLTILVLVAGFFGLALTTVAVQAASNLNSSRSNIYRAIDSAADEAACKAAGGKVETQRGQKVCWAEAACKAAGGNVLTKDGEKVCSVPFVGGALAQ